MDCRLYRLWRKAFAEPPARHTANLVVDVVAEQSVEELIQSLRIPQAIHIGFAEAERPVRQYAPIGFRIVYLYIAGLIAIEADARHAGQFAQNRRRCRGRM